MAQLAISTYHNNVEKGYALYDLPEEADLAKQTLAQNKTAANGYSYRISHWQFDDPYGGQLAKANKLLRENKIDELIEHLAKSVPQV